MIYHIAYVNLEAKGKATVGSVEMGKQEAYRMASSRNQTWSDEGSWTWVYNGDKHDMSMLPEDVQKKVRYRTRGL